MRSGRVRDNAGVTDMDEATVDQLRAVLEIVRDQLGSDMIAAYLSGSAVGGGLRPPSDLDVLVVSRRQSSPETRRWLITALLPISGSRAASGPARSIELSIAVQSDVRPWRYPPRLDFQYGDWWRPEYERGQYEPWTSPNPDLTILLAKVLHASRTLIGPPPAKVLDPIPPADLDRAMLDTVPELPGLDDDTRNCLLTLARIWVTRATGAIVPKDVAADWAIARLVEPAHRAVLAHAKAIYFGEEPEAWSDEQMRDVRAVADNLIDEIRRVGQTTLDTRGTTGPMKTAEDEVHAALAEFDRRFAAGDAGRLAEMFTEDGRMIQPHRAESVGREAIEANTRRTFEPYDPGAWRRQTRSLEVHGDRAYTVSDYAEVLVHRSGGPSLDVLGRLILFLAREADGQWRVSLAMNNHVRPVTEIPAAAPANERAQSQ